MLSADIIDDLEKDNIMVTICLVAYNHAPYIETTIQFILKQEIDFKIQLLIHDDASTDGTSENMRSNIQKSSLLLFKKKTNIKKIWQWILI